MKIVRGVHQFIGRVAGQLLERNDLRGEQRILAALRGKRRFSDWPADQTSVLEDLYASNAARIAKIERGVARTLICRLDDLRRQLSSAPPAGVGVAAAVPFAKGPPRSATPRAVGAIVHIFYPERAWEIRSYLENIPCTTDVFISTDHEAKRRTILAAFDGWAGGTMEVRVTPNRGRDIAPKLIAFKDVYDRYDYVLHLHAKTSAHDANLRLWRYFIYEALVGDESVVSSILTAFDHEPSLGVIAPQHFFHVRGALGWGDNFQLAEGLARRMGGAIRRDAPIDFPSGSMFWARSAALKPLLALDLQVEDFPDEAGQVDGTLAHAVERLYFLACSVAGFCWVKVLRTGLSHPADPWPAPIDSASDLAALLRDRSEPDSRRR